MDEILINGQSLTATIDEMVTALRDVKESGREKSLAITSLEEARLWLVAWRNGGAHNVE